MQSVFHPALQNPRSFQLLQYLAKISVIASSVQYAHVSTSVDNNNIKTSLLHTVPKAIADNLAKKL